jgi:Uncharacterized conserved protein
MTYAERVEQIIGAIVPRLEAAGYAVYLDPPTDLLPPFMKGYRPDAIALGSPKNLAIEVVLEGARPRKLTGLETKFVESDDWELRIYYVGASESQEDLDIVPTSSITSSLGSVESLAAEGKTLPALLIGWATFEAISRALLPQRLRRPQSAKQLIEALAGDGHLTPSEADLLRRLAVCRNRYSHGNLDVVVEPQDLHAFLALLRTMSVRLPKAA